MPVVETYYNITERAESLARIYEREGDRALFIVPSNLDKDKLFDLVSRGGSFFGARPAVKTWSDLYRDISAISREKPKRIIDPPDHELIITFILKRFIDGGDDLHDKLPEGVFHRGFSEILGENIRELLAEDISPEELRERLYGENEPEEGSPGSILLSLYSDYIGYLDEYGIADNAQTASLIRRCIRCDQAREALSETVFVFVGFLSFTGSQLKLVRTLIDISQRAEKGKTIFILPESGIDGFHDSIRQVGVDYRERPEVKTKLFELKAGDSQLQFDAIAKETALWAHGKGSFSSLGQIDGYGDIGLMTDPPRLPRIENALKRFKIPYNVQIRGSVSSTPIGELPRSIWRAYISGWETENTAFLLADPILRSSGPGCEAALSSFSQGAASWKKMLKKGGLAMFIRLEDLCGRLSEGGTPLEILSLWLEFLKELDPAKRVGGSIDKIPDLDWALKDISSAIGELEKKVEALDETGRHIGPAADVRLRGGEAVAYICGWGAHATLPIRLPQSRSLTVYTGIPPVLTTHRYWIMTDADHSRWPGRLRESPLFDNESKVKFNDISSLSELPEGHRPHIPELHEVREQKEALFRRLVATSTEGTVITRSLTDENARPLGPSQFAASLFAFLEKRGKKCVLGSVEYKPSDTIPGYGAHWFSEAEIPFSAPQSERGYFPRTGLRLPSEGLTASLSGLDEWNECPYRYWCRRSLRLPEHERRLFDSLKAGSLLHSLWEECRKELGLSGKNFAVLSKALWPSVLKNCYPELESDPRLERHMHLLKGRVTAVAGLLDGIEDATKGRRVKTEVEYVLPELPVGGVTFRGRADRVDFYEEGFVIVDFKSNESNKYSKGLQLAAYSLALKEGTGLEPLGYGWIGHADARFYGYFQRDEIREAYASAKPRRKMNDRKMDDFLSEAGEKLEEMAQSLVSGRFPAVYDSDMCRICEFFVTCRKREGRGDDEDPEASEGEGGDAGE